MDRRTTERLLDSAAAGRPVGPDPVVRVLRAATRPGQAGELAGEDRAVAAFRSAGLAAAPGRRSLRTSLSRLLTVRIATPAAALTAGVLGLGGVALAASTGALPDLPHVRPATHAPSTNPTRAPAPGTGGARGHLSPSASPELVGLCRAWLAAAVANPGKAAPGQLVGAAGGAERVRKYCDDLLAAAPPADDQGKATPKPSGAPSADPSKHPGKDPSKHPDRQSTPTSP